MPKLMTIKDYIAKNGETKKITSETTITDFDDFIPASRLRDRVRDTINDLEAFQQLFGRKSNTNIQLPKVWSGVFLDKNDFSLTIGNTTHHIPNITADCIKESLLDIYNGNEDMIYSLFNLPKETRTRIVFWRILIPQEERGWLRLFYTSVTNEGVRVSAVKY